MNEHSYTNDEGELIHNVTFRVCNRCVNLEGQECHTPDCVFFLHDMDEVKQILNLTLICPLVDGKRLILVEGYSEEGNGELALA